MAGLGALLLLLAATPAQATFAYSDPLGSNVFVSAVRWLERTLLGTVGTTIAVIAVASVGFQMLSGRLSWRYGARVVLGCFIIFGASSIAAGILSAVGPGQGEPVVAAAAPPPSYPAVVAPPPPPANADPFAGAALPSR
jgi:type IV secretion system protein VirB2